MQQVEMEFSSRCSQSGHRDGADGLKIIVQGSVFVMEKALLAESCEYFRALFESGMKESRQEEIKLQSVGLQGFLVLVKVLHGEHPILNSDQIVEAIECTAFLQVPLLTKHLIHIIDSENCLLMYHTASTYGVWELRHRSALFIRDMYSDLKEDLHSLPSKLVEYVASLTPSSYMAMCSHSPSSELLQDVQRTVCYLDEEQGEWKVLTELPISASTTMAGVAVLENKLYIIGGVCDVAKRVVETGFCYDPAENSWSRICGPKQRRYSFTLVGHESCLYALGGKYNMQVLSSVEQFKLSGGSWGLVSALPGPATSVVCAVAMNRLFICHWKGKGATDIYEYIPEQDSWHLVTTLVRQQSYGLFMVAHRDNLYVMRNGPSEDFLLCVMDCYNLTSGQWMAIAGQYSNSKGSLLTGVVRGDSLFTLNRHVTTEYTVEDEKWKLKRETKGFGRIGSIYAFLMRIPKPTLSLIENHSSQSQEQIVEDQKSCFTLSLQCSANI